MKFYPAALLPIFLLGSSYVRAVEDCCSTTTSNQPCDNQCTPKDHANAQAFNTIPSGGWTNHVTVLNGLEYLYASPCAASSAYFTVFPDHLDVGSCSDGNFPDCVRYSGFRLPTTAERDAIVDQLEAPPCMSPYTDVTYDHCDYGDFDSGSIVSQTDAANYAWDTIYVRPVGTADSCSMVEEPECSESKFPLVYKGKPRRCKWIGNRPSRCNNEVMKSHCPDTCGACEKYECADSLATILWRGSEVTCEELKNDPEKEKLCSRNRVKKTCRDTCGLCGSDDKIEIDFDEMDADNGIEYYRSDIQLDNWYAVNGDNYSDSGYNHGTISDPNVGFNGFGDSMSMACPSGSFSLHSVWLTPAWTNGLVVEMKGYVEGAEVASFSTVLANTTIPTFFESELSMFSGIDALVISTNPDHVAVDDMVIEIASPCVFDMKNSSVPVENMEEVAGRP